MIAEKTFVINLQSREDRRQMVIAELEKFGIADYGFWMATAKDNGVKGLLLTMRGLLEHCIALDLKTALILEDDVKFIQPRTIVEDAVKQLPEGWDMLYLGCNLSQQEVGLYSQNLIKLHGGYATHAILYSASGIKKLLRILEEGGDSPLDTQIVYLLQVFGQCFTTYPMVATQHSGFSDIEKDYVKYEKFLTDRFESKTQNLKPFGV